MNESNSLKSLAMVTNRQSWQLFWRQKNILSDVIAAYYGHCTKLVTLPQCYNIIRIMIGQLCRIQFSHWLKLSSSKLYSSDYLFICHVFEQSAWHYPYVLELRFNAIFCRNSVHATMARSQIWDSGTRIAWRVQSAEWGLLVSPVPCPCLAHNQILPQQWPGPLGGASNGMGHAATNETSLARWSNFTSTHWLIWPGLSNGDFLHRLHRIMSE